MGKEDSGPKAVETKKIKEAIESLVLLAKTLSELNLECKPFNDSISAFHLGMVDGIRICVAKMRQLL